MPEIRWTQDRGTREEAEAHVRAAATALAAARHELDRALWEAIMHRRIPVSAAAAAAGVSRQTAYAAIARAARR